MVSPLQTNYRVRHSFGKIHRVIEVPNLIAIQKRSYDTFLQSNVPPSERQDVGLQGVFKSIFPLRDFNGRSELVFAGYTLVVSAPSGTSKSKKSTLAKCR